MISVFEKARQIGFSICQILIKMVEIMPNDREIRHSWTLKTSQRRVIMEISD